MCQLSLIPTAGGFARSTLCRHYRHLGSGPVLGQNQPLSSVGARVAAPGTPTTSGRVNFSACCGKEDLDAGQPIG